jgi:membrane-bound acyltransferase YfiQ involved in biofilm formation
MKVPRILAGPLMSIAAASYFIYLTHIIPMQLFDYVEPFKDFPLSFKITAALFASLVLGLAYERIWNTFTPWLRRVVRGLRTLRIRPA